MTCFKRQPQCHQNDRCADRPQKHAPILSSRRAVPFPGFQAYQRCVESIHTKPVLFAQAVSANSEKLFHFDIVAAISGAILRRSIGQAGAGSAACFRQHTLWRLPDRSHIRALPGAKAGFRRCRQRTLLICSRLALDSVTVFRHNDRKWAAKLIVNQSPLRIDRQSGSAGARACWNSIT